MTSQTGYLAARHDRGLFQIKHALRVGNQTKIYLPNNLSVFRHRHAVRCDLRPALSHGDTNIRRAAIRAV
jgi:hypothetical protein